MERILDRGSTPLTSTNKNGWGKSIVEVLAKEIQNDFPNVKGFSVSNLWRMRNFYLEYKNNEFLPPLVAEISWSKNIVIMEKCKNSFEREFYIKMTKKYEWTKDVLINHIENKSYEKYSINIDFLCKLSYNRYYHVIK